MATYEEDEETVECSSCETQPKLFYSPTSDAPMRVRCECASADVTDSLNETSLVELTGKWSNLDHDSIIDRKG